MMNRRTIIQALKGFGYAALVIATLSVTSGVVLSHARLAAVLREAFADKTLSTSPLTEGWVDCVMLTMEYTRDTDVLMNAIDTRWPRPARHSCDDLQALLAGPPYPYPLSAADSYPNYPLGSRHLEAIVLSVLNFSQAEALYRFLSYASVAALFLGAWRSSPRLAVRVVLPIAFCLAFAFEQHRYAESLMWSPSFWVGFFALAAFVAMRAFNDPARRVGFFCFLGTIAGYLDVLQGGIPVVLSLALVLNHFFYVRRPDGEPWKVYWVEAGRQGAIVVACMVLGYVVLTVVRLTILASVLPNTINLYETGLGTRVGSVVAGVGTVHLADVVERLWSERDQLTGNDISVGLLSAAAAAWCFAIGTVAVLWRRAREAAMSLLADVAGLAVGAAVIFAWYVAFPNHTYIHAWLMVRMLALPVGYGFAGAISAYYALRPTASVSRSPAESEGRAAVY